MIKNVKLAELKAQSVTAFLNTQTDDLIENKCLRCDKKKKKKNLLNVKGRIFCYRKIISVKRYLLI